MKKVLKIAIEGAKKYIFGILICSLISSFLMIYLTKFISFAVDGVIMQTSSLPEYIRNSFYSDNVKSKLTVLAIYMLIIVGIISISNYMKSMFNTKFRLTMNKNLKSKLLELKEKEQKEKIEDLKGVQRDIAWGSQIRSYVFCPYTLVKDHRTNYEVRKYRSGNGRQFKRIYRSIFKNNDKNLEKLFTKYNKIIYNIYKKQTI